MPIYEYQCQHCGHQLELLQKTSEAPAKKCPECGKNRLQKQISATTFQLKGTGWYATDYKKPAKESAKEPKKAKLTDTAKATKPKDTDK